MTAKLDRIRFRPMSLDDLPMMHRWVNAPHVREWWDPMPTLDSVAAKYRPRILGKEPTLSFIIEAGTKAIGYIQTYRISDYPDYAMHLQTDDHAAGVDLFLGEEDYTDRGMGPLILRQFLHTVAFADASVSECIIGPEIGNHRAIRSYEKAGFRYWKTVQIPGERAPEYLMRITRRETLLNY